ncbi:MAG: (2Fe-2S)-binding protein [Acetobacteraceae bacterium]
MSTAPKLRMKGIRRRAVRFLFDGVPVEAFDGETVAVALLAAGVRSFGRNRANGARRGMFCAMGICQECIVMVEGRAVEACRQPARAGLAVRSVP